MKRRDVLALALGSASALVIGGPASAAAPTRTLRVQKSLRQLTYEEGGAVVRTFRCALGSADDAALGDKVRQGDCKTPEGEHYVAWKNPNSSFHLFLGLSYPMDRHADRALAESRIDAATHRRIVDAVKRRRQPPQDTPLGGWVGIHGGGSSSDWTLGCVAVTDEEIEWLFARTRVGDRISIEP